MNMQLDLEGIDIERVRGSVYECPHGDYSVWIGEGEDKLIWVVRRRLSTSVSILSVD